MDQRLVELCFGTPVLPRDVDLDDEGSLLDHFVRVLLGDDDPDAPENTNFGVLAAMRTAVARQLLTDEPLPAAVDAANRLLDAGISPADTLRQMTVATLAAIVASMRIPLNRVDQDDNEVGLAKLLVADHQLPDLYAALPLPDVVDIRAAVLASIRRRPGVGSDDLVDDVATLLGLEGRDPRIVETIVRHMADRLLEFGPITILAPDRLVDPASVFAGAVTTHRITENDRAAGLSLFDDDLATLVLPLDDAGDLPIGMRLTYAVTGIPIGTVVTVSVDGASISLNAVPEGTTAFDEADPELIELVHRCFDVEHADGGFAIGVAELCVAMALAEPDVWSRPHPPIVEILKAAGFERRHGRVAADDATWQYEHKFRIERRVVEAVGPESDLGRTVMRVIDGMIDDDGEPPRLTREAVGALRDPELGALLTEALVEGDDEESDDFETLELLGSLLEHARHDDERVAALWLAAMFHERRGQLIEAERRVAEAHRLDADWNPLLERAGWFAFLRGDALTALQMWRRQGKRGDREMALAERLGSTTSSGLGRNDPCWCGSGRKFKACHLGAVRPVTPADQVDWLWAKAVGFMVRSGDEAIGDIAELCGALLDDASDERELRAAFESPVVLDAALVFFDWFAEFVQHAGGMLPADELELAHSWLRIDPSVYEVTAAGEDTTTLRELNAGQVVEVSGRLPGRSVTVGEHWAARVVPDRDAGRHFVGGAFRVPESEVDEVTAILLDGAPVALCEWLRDQSA